jgi:hypothetical protein
MSISSEITLAGNVVVERMLSFTVLLDELLDNELIAVGVLGTRCTNDANRHCGESTYLSSFPHLLKPNGEVRALTARHAVHLAASHLHGGG